MTTETPDGRSETMKSPSAFRTISEVANELDLPQHVLRFWETKFPQLKPLKRGGGRRYYRPEDLQLLERIRDLLYVDGYTIKGVQKLLRKSGSVRHFIEDNQPDENAQDPSLENAAMDEASEASISAGVAVDLAGLEQTISDLKSIRERLLNSAG